jgi:hypothetical protein
MIPRAFIGSDADGKIYALNQGHMDDATGVDFLAESNPVAPGGTEMDCIFNRLYVTLTWSMPVTVRCTPVVDGVAITASQFDIVLAALPTSERQSKVYDRALYQPHVRGGVAKYRKALRGTWFAIRVQSINGIGPGDIIVDEVNLDYDVESPSKEAVT